MKRYNEEQRHLFRAMMIDLTVMCVGVLCCLLPDPWKYLVLIFIGARTIIKDFITEIKKPAPKKTERRTREQRPYAEEKDGYKARKETDNAKAAGKTCGKQKTASNRGE